MSRCHINITASDNFFLPNLKYEFDIGNTRKVYAQEDIEHTRFFNPNYNSVEESYEGLSVFQVAAKVVQVGNDRWDAKKSTAGTDKFGGVRVTNKNLKYISMAMSSTDLQLIEQGVISLRAICNVLGLDSSLFNDPSNKTFNNRLEAEKAMYTNVIIPLADKIAAKHNNYIVKNHYPDGNYRMRKDYSKVESLQKDKKQEAQKDKIVMDGVNVILNMPISNESKVLMIKDNYKLSEDVINSLKTMPNEPISD